MDLRPLVLAILPGVAVLAAQAPAATPLVPAAPATDQAQADPFLLPKEARDFALRVTMSESMPRQKLHVLLRAIFRAKTEGGMGLVYDNSRTRTVAEVWTDGQANCLSLTAFFVMTCRAIGIRDEFAEAMNTNHWRKVGGIVHYERHVVALTPLPPASDLIADFVPELRKRYGAYMVSVIPETRFRALYYSNRAAEDLTDGNLEAARVQAQKSLDADPQSSVGWNVLGVVNAAQGDAAKAEKAYLRAMELDPKDGAPIGNMEALLREAGRLDEAQRYRARGELVRGKDPYFHAYLAEEALVNGDLAEAALRIRNALRIQPRESDFHLLAARVRLQEGDLDAALKCIEEAKRWADPAERARYDNKLSIIQGMKEGKAVPPPG